MPGQVAPVARVASGAVNWLVVDHLGSVVNILDGSGNPLTTVVYDGFGDIVSDSNPSNLGKFAYTGDVYLSNLEQYAAGPRVYNPETGTWGQPDPSGFPDGPNGYEYVRNNPTNKTDPSGL